MESNRKRQSSEKGFALATALMACAILFALATLIIQLSTGDLKVSVKNVGDKKAMIAAESGIHRLVQDFSSDSTTWTAANNYTTNCTATTPTYIWQTIVSGVDANTRYAVCAPTESTLPPVRMAGYALGGGDEGGWGIMRYDAGVVGKNDSYNSSVSVGVGIGYGPVPIR
jgi:Tfp pilus assembly protein PilX